MLPLGSSCLRLVLAIAWNLLLGRRVEQEKYIGGIRSELVELVPAIYDHDLDGSRGCVGENLASAIGIHGIGSEVGPVRYGAAVADR